ncbi:phospholipid phosphatase 1-like [Choloepus didactylus]|uniref:phospholipid phosphatase 1-like n=1 Tax=Choloepus didactylus TaxID=27675 RepID=UPI0018A0CCB5|nr:phospholipid phosphatase 1-like [Choloepus didactylus]
MGFLISIFTISLGEVLHVQSLQLNSWAFVNSMYVIVVYKQLGAFIFGSMVNCSLASIAKMTMGHLRPHFLAVCRPDPTSFNCDSGFISNYTCTGDPAEVLEARKSCSEHTSFGIYSMLYLMLYMQARYRGCKARLLRPTVQLFFLSLALCAGYIRTLDYWHHPRDMAVGFLQGALVAAWELSTSLASLTPKRSYSGRWQQPQALGSGPPLSSPFPLALPADHQQSWGRWPSGVCTARKLPPSTWVDPGSPPPKSALPQWPDTGNPIPHTPTPYNPPQPPHHHHHHHPPPLSPVPK